MACFVSFVPFLFYHYGRPTGSKNKKTLEREALAATQGQCAKQGRGRPKGSKNKKTLEREAMEASLAIPVKRGRGRPKGAKNKKTSEQGTGQPKQ